MTANRDKDADKKATLKVLQSINKGQLYQLDANGVSWLGHKDGGGQIDALFAFGASMPEGDEARRRVNSHFSHLRVQHGLEVIESGGIYRITASK